LRDQGSLGCLASREVVGEELEDGIVSVVRLVAVAKIWQESTKGQYMGWHVQFSTSLGI
jgi:putative lipoic acid-binding regulatory protein